VNRATVSSTGVGGKGQGAWLCTQQLRECDFFGPDGPHRRPKLVQFIGSGDEGDGICLCVGARPRRSLSREMTLFFRPKYASCFIFVVNKPASPGGTALVSVYPRHSAQGCPPQPVPQRRRSPMGDHGWQNAHLHHSRLGRQRGSYRNRRGARISRWPTQPTHLARKST
jgi:hypothetical protein